MKTLSAIAFVAAVAWLGAQSQPSRMVEWANWAGDNAQTKYSTLSDITPDNVGRLQKAWQWEPGEVPQQQYETRPGAFAATPLMVDNVLYLSTAYHRAVALDAESGAQIWAFDPEAWKGLEDNIGLKHRGLAVWRAGGETRVFLNTDERLFALDAKTGTPIPSFGQGGVASLTEGWSERRRKRTSARRRLRSSTTTWSSSAAGSRIEPVQGRSAGHGPGL